MPKICLKTFALSYKSIHKCKHKPEQCCLHFSRWSLVTKDMKTCWACSWPLSNFDKMFLTQGPPTGFLSELSATSHDVLTIVCLFAVEDEERPLKCTMILFLRCLALRTSESDTYNIWADNPVHMGRRPFMLCSTRRADLWAGGSHSRQASTLCKSSFLLHKSYRLP